MITKALDIYVAAKTINIPHHLSNEWQYSLNKYFLMSGCWFFHYENDHFSPTVKFWLFLKQLCTKEIYIFTFPDSSLHTHTYIHTPMKDLNIDN